jgi:hypothetical protein
MADTGHALFARAVVVDNFGRDLIVFGTLRVGGQGVDQHFCRPFRRSQMDAAGAAQRRGDRGLHRFRRAVINQTRGDDMGHHAMLDQYDHQRVEHLRFVGGRQTAAQDQRGHVREGDLAN